MTGSWTRLRDDRGDAGGHALELLVIAPVMLAFVLLLVAYGRTSSVDSEVAAAAASAARAASQQYDAVSAQRAAAVQAQKSMSDAGVRCADPLSVEVDTSGFTAPVGQPGSVVVQVRARSASLTSRCRVCRAVCGFPGGPPRLSICSGKERTGLERSDCGPPAAPGDGLV